MPKAINITGITQGRLYINPISSGSTLIERDYRVIGDDTLFNEIGLQVLSAEIAWSAVPANIKSALIAIDQWTNNEINVKVGL